MCLKNFHYQAVSSFIFDLKFKKNRSPCNYCFSFLEVFLSLVLTFFHRARIDTHTEVDDFHQSVAVPFLNALINEMEAAFDMSSLEPVEALMVLDPNNIPTNSDAILAEFGKKEIKILQNFYGNTATDTYGERTITSPPLINATIESLYMEYDGYKNYISKRKKDVADNLLEKEKKLVSNLALAKSNKNATKKSINPCTWNMMATKTTYRKEKKMWPIIC